MNFGARIKLIRTSLGLTQAAFAAPLGCSASLITLIEKGKTESSTSLRKAVCREYNVNPLYLDGESDVMFVLRDEDEELIDAALAGGDPLIRALLLGIVKKPDGWRMLAESVIACADYLRDQGIDLGGDGGKEKPGQ